MLYREHDPARDISSRHRAVHCSPVLSHRQDVSIRHHLAQPRRILCCRPQETWTAGNRRLAYNGQEATEQDDCELSCGLGPDHLFMGESWPSGRARRARQAKPLWISVNRPSFTYSTRSTAIEGCFPLQMNPSLIPMQSMKGYPYVRSRN